MPEVVRFRVATGERPITLNAERKGSRWDRSTAAKAWKTATTEALLEHRLTAVRFERVDVILRPIYPPRSGNLPDTGGLQPTEKAIVDAIVDAEVIPDDNRHHVRAITSQAPGVADVGGYPVVLVQLEAVPVADTHPLRVACGCRPRRRR